MAERTKAVSRSIRIAEDEAKWLSVAADRGGVSQNELIRLAVHRLRKDLGAASRVKPETVQATAKASKYKLTPQRPASSAKPPRTAASRHRRGTWRNGRSRSCGLISSPGCTRTASSALTIGGSGFGESEGVVTPGASAYAP